MRLERGTELVAQGAKSRGLYFVRKGSCKVVMRPPGMTATAAGGRANRFGSKATRHVFGNALEVGRCN